MRNKSRGVSRISKSIVSFGLLTLFVAACNVEPRVASIEGPTPASRDPEILLHVSRTGARIAGRTKSAGARPFRGRGDLPIASEGQFPRLNLRVDGDVSSEHVATVLAEIPPSWEMNLIPSESHAASIPVNRGFECACLAEEPAQACVQPLVQLFPLDTRVVLTSGWKGPCRVPKRMSPLYDVPAPGDRGGELRIPPKPTIHSPSGNQVLGNPVIVPRRGQCSTRSTPTLDSNEFAVLLRRASAKAPGCPYDSLQVAPGVPWSAVEKGLRASVQAGLSPHLSFSVEQISGCEEVILEESLPAPLDPVPPPQARDVYCARTMESDEPQ